MIVPYVYDNLTLTQFLIGAVIGISLGLIIIYFIEKN